MSQSSVQKSEAQKAEQKAELTKAITAISGEIEILERAKFKSANAIIALQIVMTGDLTFEIQSVDFKGQRATDISKRWEDVHEESLQVKKWFDTVDEEIYSELQIRRSRLEQLKREIAKLK